MASADRAVEGDIQDKGNPGGSWGGEESGDDYEPDNDDNPVLQSTRLHGVPHFHLLLAPAPAPDHKEDETNMDLDVDEDLGGESKTCGRAGTGLEENTKELLELENATSYPNSKSNGQRGHDLSPANELTGHASAGCADDDNAEEAGKGGVDIIASVVGDESGDGGSDDDESGLEGKYPSYTRIRRETRPI
ncbi:hypothetical protein GALMADRAFT_147342 [Galerina marginata CBS 339.88]|uniref:Uncharacterized protein n=1 Tax=Galerina marginata (strain CBS 339.88) TaxID=685588 RepID=A0A067SK33_GALM3|nr:hypothetical protein GALMADRAFT_147342 [Galerina marginata CBS 339.88]